MTAGHAPFWPDSLVSHERRLVVHTRAAGLRNLDNELDRWSASDRSGRCLECAASASETSCAMATARPTPDFGVSLRSRTKLDSTSMDEPSKLIETGATRRRVSSLLDRVTTLEPCPARYRRADARCPAPA